MEGRMLFEFARDQGFRVEPDGRIFGASGKQIQGWLHKATGYWYFTVRLPAGHRHHKSIKVHRFQAYQKFGNAIFEENVVVRHKDSNKDNNTWDNILIGTPLENSADMPKEQRVARAAHAASFVRRFSDADIAKMHEMRSVQKMTYKAIALAMGIKSKGHVCQILSGEIYQNHTRS